MKHVLTCCFIVLVFNPSIADNLDAHVVWASPSGDGALHYACFCGEKWTEPGIISGSSNVALAPAIVSIDRGLVVFWVELLANSFKKPYLSEMTSIGEWSAPVEINTEVNSTSAIAGIIDNQGQLWLSWSGNDWDLKDVAKTSNIYAGRFENGRIVSIEPVHPADELSNLMPRIAIDELTGKPVVSWLTLDPNQPVMNTAIRSDNGWQSVGAGAIEARFDSPSISSNTMTGIVPLSSLDLPVPKFIDPEEDQIAILFKELPRD